MKSLACILVVMPVLMLSGCAAMNPPDAGGPRNLPAYPVMLVQDEVREEATLLALRRLSQRLGTFEVSDAKLQPITSTIAALPAVRNPLLLPKVGAEPTMTEEETREALRRFIREWQELIGADPAELSLVERVDQPDGTKLARYEQRPFRYPIRGRFGKLEIHFAADRRVLNISSTCIPEAARLHTALSGAAIKLNADDAIAAVRSKELAYIGPQGTPAFFKVPAGMTLNARELVIYIESSKSTLGALEFHVAWEVQLEGAPVKFVYVDAIDGELITAE